MVVVLALDLKPEHSQCHSTQGSLPAVSNPGWLQRSSSIFKFFVFFNFLKFILFLAALGLCCWAQAFSSCGEQGLLFIAVLGLLIAVASLVAKHGL